MFQPLIMLIFFKNDFVPLSRKKAPDNGLITIAEGFLWAYSYSFSLIVVL